MAVDGFVMTFNSDDEVPSEEDEAPTFGDSETAPKQRQKARGKQKEVQKGKGKGAVQDRKRKRSVLEEIDGRGEDDSAVVMNAEFTFDGLGGGLRDKAAGDVWVRLYPIASRKFYV
jgi:hypothetical protein